LRYASPHSWFYQVRNRIAGAWRLLALGWRSRFGLSGSDCDISSLEDELLRIGLSGPPCVGVLDGPPIRIVEIERTKRGTAYRNMMKRFSVKAVLERELERLIEEWSK